MADLRPKVSVKIVDEDSNVVAQALTLADNVVNGDVAAVGAFGMWFDGSTWDRALGDSTDGLLVNLGSNNDVSLAALPTSPDTLADDALFTVATSPVFPFGAFADETAPDSVGEGDIGAVRMSLNRNLYTVLRDAAGSERGANVTAAFELNVIATAQPGVDIGDVDVLTLPSNTFVATDSAYGLGVLIQGDDGTDRHNILTDVNGHLQVDVLTGGGTDTPTSPVNDYNTSVALAAGSTANLDTVDFGAATKKATKMFASASVDIKAEFGFVDNDVLTTLAVGFAKAGDSVTFFPRHRDYWEHTFAALGGFDGFRIIVTNLDQSQPADVYGTILYED